MTTEQAARARDLSDLLEESPPDPGLAAMAGRIATRLSVRRARSRRDLERGTGLIRSAPWAYRSDDVDIDATVERMVAAGGASATGIVVRERMGCRRSAVLVVDLSGSMNGERARVAAATVGALALEFSGPLDRFGVVAFWSDAAVVAPLGRPESPGSTVNRLLRIPARGLTNIGFGLAVARAELERAGPGRRTTLLLTDAVHNAGPDPRIEARRASGLLVLLETTGEHDEALGRDLARLGGGLLRRVAGYRDVAPALNEMFALRP